MKKIIVMVCISALFFAGIASAKRDQEVHIKYKAPEAPLGKKQAAAAVGVKEVCINHHVYVVVASYYGAGITQKMVTIDDGSVVPATCLVAKNK